MKSVLETHAKSPDDPSANLEIGRFLCFVKGNWDLGLRFMVKGSDATLKRVAEKELTFPVLANDRVSLADEWYDLSDKEKSALRKGKLLSHAKSLYESALPDCTALVRARIEKRLGEMGRASASGTVDLLKLVNPRIHAVADMWELSAGRLVSPKAGGTPFPRIVVPYIPPAEYDLTCVIEARDKESPQLGIGLVARGQQFTMCIDWGGSCGVEVVDGQTAAANQTTTKVKVFANTQPRIIVCSIRKSSLTVTADGTKLVDWKDFSPDRVKLSAYPLSNDKSLFLVGTGWTLNRMVLTTLSGVGQAIR